MLVRVLSEELADTRMRINEAIVYPDTSMRRRACDPSEGLAVIAWEQSPHGRLLRSCTGARGDDSVRRSINHS